MLCPGVPSHPCRFYPSGARDAVAAHTPSGALLKAVLLGGASPMLGNTGAWLMQRRKLVQLQVGTQGRSMCMWVGMFWFWCQAHRMSWLYGLATTNPLSAPPPLAPVCCTEAFLPLEPAPSFRQGYGRVNLTRSLPLADNAGSWRMQVRSSLFQGACVRSIMGPGCFLSTMAMQPAS